MHVLLADQLLPMAKNRLEAAGLRVSAEPKLKGEQLEDYLQGSDPDVLVVRSTRVTEKMMAAAPSLSLIVRAGAGVNTIDLAAASARGIYVANCPGTNASAVAELTWAHILNADRALADNIQALREGRWAKKEFSAARGLRGRTLGIIGLGNIGRRVAQVGDALGMEILVWSRSLGPDQVLPEGWRVASSALAVASSSDVVSVNLALAPETRGFVGSTFLEAMRPGSIFVNTSRGEVVDEEALREAVRERGLRVGLDVFLNEPSSDGPWEQELAKLSGFYGSHHIGASTQQAQEAVAEMVCSSITEFMMTGAASSCVNVATQTPATHMLLVRHLDQVGVLAGVLERLKEASLNVKTMENVIFGSGGVGGAACARIRLVGEPSAALLQALRDMDTILHVQVISLAA